MSLVWRSCLLSLRYFHLLCILVYSSHLASSSPLHLYLPGFSSASLSTPLHPYLLIHVCSSLSVCSLHQCLHLRLLVYYSACLSTPLHPCLLLCIRIYSSAPVSTPTSASLFLPLHECQDPCPISW
jgi:hypothetical protein